MSGRLPRTVRRVVGVLVVATVVTAGLRGSLTSTRPRPHVQRPTFVRLFVPDCGAHVARSVAADGAIAGGAPECASGLAFDALGVLPVIDGRTRRLVVLDRASGSFTGSSGLGLRALLRSSDALAMAADGTVYVGTAGNSRVRVLDPAGRLLASDGLPESSLAGREPPDVEPARRALLAVGADLGVYFADPDSNRVLRVGADQRTTVVAGNGQGADTGDGGPAVQAALLDPRSMAVDGSGRLYVSEGAGRRIRRIGTDGIITTLAGGSGGATGQDRGRRADWAGVDRPGDLAVSPAGDVYVVDAAAGRVRRVAPDGTVSTLPP